MYISDYDHTTFPDAKEAVDIDWSQSCGSVTARVYQSLLKELSPLQ
jgi:hypothetical protein